MPSRFSLCCRAPRGKLPIDNRPQLTKLPHKGITFMSHTRPAARQNSGRGGCDTMSRNLIEANANDGREPHKAVEAIPAGLIKDI
jgi:hypothetical protein